MMKLKSMTYSLTHSLTAIPRVTFPTNKNIHQTTLGRTIVKLLLTIHLKQSRQLFSSLRGQLVLWQPLVLDIQSVPQKKVVLKDRLENLFLVHSSISFKTLESVTTFIELFQSKHTLINFLIL